MRIFTIIFILLFTVLPQCYSLDFQHDIRYPDQSNGGMFHHPYQTSSGYDVQYPNNNGHSAGQVYGNGHANSRAYTSGYDMQNYGRGANNGRQSYNAGYDVAQEDGSMQDEPVDNSAYGHAFSLAYTKDSAVDGGYGGSGYDIGYGGQNYNAMPNDYQRGGQYASQGGYDVRPHHDMIQARQQQYGPGAYDIPLRVHSRRQKRSSEPYQIEDYAGGRTKRAYDDQYGPGQHMSAHRDNGNYDVGYGPSGKYANSGQNLYGGNKYEKGYGGQQQQGYDVTYGAPQQQYGQQGLYAGQYGGAPGMQQQAQLYGRNYDGQQMQQPQQYGVYGGVQPQQQMAYPGDQMQRYGRKLDGDMPYGVQQQQQQGGNQAVSAYDVEQQDELKRPPMPLGGPYDIGSMLMMDVPETQADIGLESYDTPAIQTRPKLTKVQNMGAATVINTGTALDGTLQAAGSSKTKNGPKGSMSMGTGMMSGMGVGLSGTSVNNANARTDGLFGGSTASGMLVNNMKVDKGKIFGQSDTSSVTGLNGMAASQANGRSFGTGRGVQLTQVANSESAGSSALVMPDFDNNFESMMDMDLQPWRFKRSAAGPFAESVLEQDVPALKNFPGKVITFKGENDEPLGMFIIGRFGNSKNGGISFASTSMHTSEASDKPLTDNSVL